MQIRGRGQFHALATAREFFVEGARHIWAGFDHMLLVIALLLAAALLRGGAGWSPWTPFWPTTREVTKVVTAFTLAHSPTLALSFFGVVRLPSHRVELATAALVFADAARAVVLRSVVGGRGGVGLEP